MAKDIYHNTVQEALINDGWEIVNSAYVVELPTSFKALDDDFEYNEMLLAQKEEQVILVNPNSFLSQSLETHFHYVFGECLMIKQLTDFEFIDMAMPDIIYNHFKYQKLMFETLRKHNVRVIVFNPETKRIEKWIK